MCIRPDDDDYRSFLHPALMDILTTTWPSHVNGCTWTLENNGFSMPTTRATAYEPSIHTFYTCSTSHVALVCDFMLAVWRCGLCIAAHLRFHLVPVVTVSNLIIYLRTFSLESGVLWRYRRYAILKHSYLVHRRTCMLHGGGGVHLNVLVTDWYIFPARFQPGCDFVAPFCEEQLDRTVPSTGGTVYRLLVGASRVSFRFHISCSFSKLDGLPRRIDFIKNAF